MLKKTDTKPTNQYLSSSKDTHEHTSYICVSTKFCRKHFILY